jgi:hypothetical protein
MPRDVIANGGFDALFEFMGVDSDEDDSDDEESEEEQVLNIELPQQQDFRR